MISGPGSFTCTACNVTFDKKSKLSFHKPCCSENVNTQNVVPVDNVETDPNSTKEHFLPVEVVPKEPLPVSNGQLIIQDDFHNESLNTSTETMEDQSVFFGGTGFKMPDNFDLPDEIIQEQLPTGRTSTPIRYADPGDKEKQKEEKCKEATSKISTAKVSQSIPTSSRQSSNEEKSSKGLNLSIIFANAFFSFRIFIVGKIMKYT